MNKEKQKTKETRGETKRLNHERDTMAFEQPKAERLAKLGLKEAGVKVETQRSLLASKDRIPNQPPEFSPVTKNIEIAGVLAILIGYFANINGMATIGGMAFGFVNGYEKTTLKYFAQKALLLSLTIGVVTSLTVALGFVPAMIAPIIATTSVTALEVGVISGVVFSAFSSAFYVVGQLFRALKDTLL